jgi:anti-anti-sigma factor
MTSESRSFRLETSEGALRIEATGNLVASSVEGQREFLLKTLEEPAGKVVLDLALTDQVDSLGITLILGLFKTCQKSKIEFQVDGVSPSIMRVFRLFSLPKLFPVAAR